MTTGLGLRLDNIEKQWKNISKFAFRNPTIPSFIFIVIYALEQVSLILLIYFMTSYIRLIVSLFAVIILTTFAFHKLTMESHIRLLEEKITDLSSDTDKMEEKTLNIGARYLYMKHKYDNLKKISYRIRDKKEAPK